MKKKPFSEIPYIKGSRIELRQLTVADAPALREMTEDPEVYRYLPTFLFEKKYPDTETVIERLYTEAWQDSIILGIFMDGSFCGLAEMYGFQDEIHKISLGCRLVKRCWGQGIAREAVGLMVDYLYEETDIEIITASTMVVNQAIAKVVEKLGFSLVSHAAEEDWGFETPTIADKWIR